MKPIDPVRIGIKIIQAIVKVLKKEVFEGNKRERNGEKMNWIPIVIEVIAAALIAIIKRKGEG